MIAVAPAGAVTEGYGTEAEQRQWLQRRREHAERVEAARAAGQPDPEPFTEPNPFEPWMMDHSKLVPDLVAAVQGLAAKVDDLTARIAQLEGTA
jgi:hypothetical protein